MSTLTPSMHEAPHLDETRTVPSVTPVTSVPLAAVKLSWGAILGGLVVTLGVWILLTVGGLAAGLSSVDPRNPVSLQHAGVGTGIWTLAVALVSLLLGGLVAARTAGIVDRTAGAIHGAVLWGIALLATVFMVGSIVSGVASTAVGLGRGVAGPAGHMMRGPMGMDANALLGPVNERLRAEGKPTVTPAEIEAATRDAMQTGMREGRFDREMLVTSLAAHTKLSQDDARQVADDIEARMSAERQQIQTGVLEAADTTGKALWWVFLAMALGLGASVVGSTLGVSRRQRIAATTRVPLVPRTV